MQGLTLHVGHYLKPRRAWYNPMVKQSKTMELRKFPVPRWVAVVYGVLTLALIPWTVNLSYSLPYHHISRHWDVAWVGFNLMLLMALALTAYFALTKSAWVVLSAMAACSLLLADAWLDVWTSRPGHQMEFAIIIALCLELPLAFASFWLARRAGRQLING